MGKNLSASCRAIRKRFSLPMSLDVRILLNMSSISVT
uniref:Uncharacterized protein n=1 Tax=Arundo donax TaxID=35708 RepID=A0A0A8ZSA1_ARUDO